MDPLDVLLSPVGAVVERAVVVAEQDLAEHVDITLQERWAEPVDEVGAHRGFGFGNGLQSAPLALRDAIAS